MTHAILAYAGEAAHEATHLVDGGMLARYVNRELPGCGRLP